MFQGLSRGGKKAVEGWGHARTYLGRSMSCTPSQFRKRGRGKIVGSNGRWHNGSVAVRRWAGKAAWLIKVMAGKLLANKGMASKDGHPPTLVGNSLEKTNTTSSRQQNNRTTLLLVHVFTHRDPIAIQKDERSDQDLGGQSSRRYGASSLGFSPDSMGHSPFLASGAWGLWRKSHDLENGPPRAPQP